MPIRNRKSTMANRRGATAVEMALVAPFLVAIFLGITQFGSTLFTRHTMIQAAREGARELAIEGATEAEAEAATEAYLASMGITGATVTATNAFSGGGETAEARRVNVVVSISAEDASILGDALNVFSDDDIVVTVSMRKEGELATAPSS